MLTPALFEQNRPRLNLEMVGKLKFSDFFQGNVPVSLDNLCASTGINFSLVTYMRIHAFFEPLLNRFVRRLNEKSITICDFLGTKKGDSKKVRKILSKRINSVAVLRLRNITTFFRITGTVAGEALVKQLLGMWSQHYLPNKIREFAFKFLNNSLSINTMCKIDREDAHYAQLRVECQYRMKHLSTCFMNVLLPEKYMKGFVGCMISRLMKGKLFFC
jgi:hypothetical protein